jgi:TolB-like protein
MYRIIVILILVICSCSTTSNYYSFDNALETGSERIQIDLPEDSKVAILDFKSDNENLSSYIIEEMYDKLINFGKLVIMERSRTDTIALEVGYQLSGEVDDNEIVKIGHQLGADYVVTGEIAFSGEAYRLRVFAIDIEKGRRVTSTSLNINRNDRQINHLISIKTTTHSWNGIWNNATEESDPIMVEIVRDKITIYDISFGYRIFGRGTIEENGKIQLYVETDNGWETADDLTLYIEQKEDKLYLYGLDIQVFVLEKQYQ